MGLMTSISRFFTWWDRQTHGTQLFTWRNGVRVGSDAQGNVFYRTKDDSRRWVIFNGLIEASKVSPDWHGWLHRTWNEPPTDKPLAHKAWERPHQENLTGSTAAYAPTGSIRRSETTARTDYEPWVPE